MIIPSTQHHKHYHPQAMPLDMYHKGTTVTIIEVRGGRGIIQRLKEMGIGAGETVRILKNHRPGGLVLEVMDSKLCIGRGVAHKIQAEQQI